MKCPECGSRTYILDSREYKDNKFETVRRRKCRKCGNELYTLEAIFNPKKNKKVKVIPKNNCINCASKDCSDKDKLQAQNEGFWCWIKKEKTA